VNVKILFLQESYGKATQTDMEGGREFHGGSMEEFWEEDIQGGTK
jgi:hypothetical protein